MTAPRNASVLLLETDQEYRAKAKDHLSSHALADFRKCPMLYRRKKLGLIEDEDRPAYLLGRAVHTLVLEGQEKYQHEYAVGGPVNPRTKKPFGPTTQAYLDWAAAQGKPVLTAEQDALSASVAAAVRGHRAACGLLSEGVPEGVVRAEYCGVPCQIRMDWFSPQSGIVDLKTCDDLTWFEADARRYGYAYQLAFYRAVLTVSAARGNLESPPPCHILAVEKKEPFRCGVWLLSDQVLSHCQRENEAAIARLKECERRDAWPSGYEETRVFDSV